MDPLVSDVGTEELGHLEMIGAIVYQLTRNLSLEEIKKNGFVPILLTTPQVFIQQRQAAHQNAKIKW